MKPALILAAIALLCSSGVVMVNSLTAHRIDMKRQEKIQQSLQDVLPQLLHNNQLIHDTIEVSDPLLGSSDPQTVWRARLDNKPAGAILSATAPDGYAGPVTLLVGVTATGTITGVRVVEHRETPGLGDDIELTKSDWVLGFNDTALLSYPESAWRVKKDGGHFDQFTGATITPRAVTSAVHSALLFFRDNQEMIFASDN